MILFKLYIFLTLILLTKQDIFWNFLSSNEFSTSNKTAILDLRKFAKNSQEAVENTLCLEILSIGLVRIVYDSRCDCVPNRLVKHINESLTNTSCHLHGEVTITNYLKNSDAKDDLVFISFDGCNTIDDHGKSTNGTFLVSNNVNIDYNEILNHDYFWKRISDDSWIQCNRLCNDLSFIRCYKELTKDEKKRLLYQFRDADRNKNDWMNPVQEQQKPNWASGNELLIAIVFGVFLVVVMIVIVIYIIKLA